MQPVCPPNHRESPRARRAVCGPASRLELDLLIGSDRHNQSENGCPFYDFPKFYTRLTGRRITKLDRLPSCNLGWHPASAPIANATPCYPIDLG